MATPRSFQIILQALATVPKATLRFVGDGPDRPALEKLAADLRLGDRVVFEGWKNQDQLREIYSRTHAFVFSSFAEGIPVVLMEAMAMAIPCIAPRITGIPELIRDGVEGLLYSASDGAGLSVAIKRLVDNPVLCQSMGEAARARVLELYDLNLNISELAAIFVRRTCSIDGRTEDLPTSHR
jgi:glycosyltransferase involved in cell wall biosynthesis